MINWINSLDPQLISIVLPTYNRPNFLKMAIFNIAATPHRRFEIIVIDDGSDSKLQKENQLICEEYQKLLKLDIKYIYLTTNSGTVSIPRNIGISHISGKIIAPADDDCLFRCNKLELLQNALTESYILAFGNRTNHVMNTDGYFVENRTFNCEFLTNDQRALGVDNGQFIYRADVYEHIEPILSINACDWELYKRIADLGKFSYINEVVCDYLWHGKNISLTPKPARKDPSLLVKDYLDYFQDGPFKDKVKRKYCS